MDQTIAGLYQEQRSSIAILKGRKRFFDLFGCQAKGIRIQPELGL